VLPAALVSYASCCLSFGTHLPALSPCLKSPYMSSNFSDVPETRVAYMNLCRCRTSCRNSRRSIETAYRINWGISILTRTAAYTDRPVEEAIQIRLHHTPLTEIKWQSYWLDDRGSIAGRSWDILSFAIAYGPALELTQPPIQCAPGALSSGVKRPECEPHHSSLSSAEVKNAWIYTSTPIRLQVVPLN
jgi:hypothetical protein